MKRLVRAALPVCLAFVMTLAPLAAQAAPAKNVSSATKSISMQKCEQEIKAMLDETSSAKRQEAFYSTVSDRFKYVSVRSLCGKSGKWLAFVDIYSQYNGGEPTGYILQQAYVQYGVQKLPSSTENVTLKIGNVVDQIKYKDQSVFNFKPKSLESTANTDTVTVTVQHSGISMPIYVSQQFPSSDVPTARQAVYAIAPYYATHVNKDKINPFDHTFLKLKSYLSNSKTMERSYIWELYLVHDSNLPSKATILRYDCDTKRVSISEREIREYF